MYRSCKAERTVQFRLGALVLIKLLMKIQLWYCESMKQWRWILTDDSRPIVRQESGQRPDLRDAMNDVATTVEYMMQCK